MCERQAEISDSQLDFPKIDSLYENVDLFETLLEF
jgi:hypothetical protein